MSTPIAPLLHNNGTGAEDLFAQYANATGALRALEQALPAPNGRDYYPMGDTALAQATHQRDRWVAALRSIQADLETILESIADQRDARRG